ncbi:GumC family protein [Acidisoma silvae]|uniref:Uncharacterized protein n=1 Tax=Acidisoma silvae TaxID=2802396 RepID=A0A963YVZ7_9PROT|nr:polysaccharide biosynthesis tyrosine autokinase [Acidisoma silvae]MCB8878166.1 hypothetical protein [Acidisoma silvae]
MDLRTILEIVLPRKLSILFGGLLFAIFAFFLSGMAPVRYTSTGYLMFDAPKDQTAATMTRITDIDVLLSPTLLTEVASLPAIYQRPDLVPSLRLPSFRDMELPKTLFGYAIPTWHKAAHPTKQQKGALTDHINGIAAYLHSSLKVTGDPDSRVIAIAFSAGNASLAATVVNELMARYIATDYEARLATVVAPNAWLTAQVTAAAKDAAAADGAIAAFQRTHNVSSSSQGSYADINLSRQWDLLSAAKQQLSDAELSQSLVKSGFDDASASSPQIQILRERQIQMSQQLAAAQASLGPANLGQQEIQNQLNAIRRQMAAASGKAAGSVGERVAVAQARVDALQGQVDQAAAAAAVASENEFDLHQLMASAQSKHSVYDNLLGRLHDSELSATQLTHAQIVSQATIPSLPESARTVLYVILGFVVGCLLTVSVLVQRHFFNARIGSVSILSSFLRVPNLGSLPIIGSRRGTLGRLALDHPHGAIAETLRGIRLRLQEYAQGTAGVVVLVTSAERGEGKTSVAAALALRAAGDGLSVLLIEGDLHRPSLSEDFKMANGGRGLEAAVSGKLQREKVLEIHRETGLHCLFARASVPNAVAFLDSHGFRRLVEEGRSIYDLVVIDGPPLLRVPDPLVLSRLVDRIIWVMRAERTPQRVIAEALKRLPADRRALVATVITGAPKRMLTGLGFYAGYSGRGHFPVIMHEPAATWPEVDER